MSYLDILRTQLPMDEGQRLFPYRDTMGKLTIGVGHNLTDNGISNAVQELMLSEDIAAAESLARGYVPTFDSLSDVRRAVVVNMAFNMGTRLGGFTKTLAAIRDGRWDDAANGMLASVWAGEVGVRANRLAYMMRSDSNG